MSTPAGDDLIGNASIRVDANTDPAVLALAGFSRDAQGRIRDVRGRFVAEGTIINRALIRAAGGGDRFGGALRALAGAASGAAGVLGRVGVGIAGIGAAAGSAAPLLAGIVTTLQNLAPAGAVAVTGMLAIQQASAAVRLGMVGVEDAVTAAFDTSKEGAKKFQESLKGLSPSAAAFAVQVRKLAPAFREFQQTIQEELFNELDSVLKRVATATLPVLRSNLTTTANILGNMAAQTGLAAAALAKDGTLGRAMDGANQGLRNLEGLPAQVTTALGQLAVAGAPAFDRITAAAGRAATGISKRLGAAFESQALERAVNQAVDLLRDLGTVAGNVFSTLGNIAAPIQQAGGGLIGTLKEITGALKDATGTQAFQSAIGSLASVMGTLARTVGPLLGQALAAIGPIFTTLGPPVERLITNLGAGLSPIITALGPVLAAAAGAIGALVDALSPLLPVVGNLIASLLPPLVPLLTAIGDVFRQAGPVVQLLANSLQTALAPILAQLPALIQPLATNLTTLASTVFPTLARLIVALAPSLAQMGAAFGQVLVAAAPLLTAISQLSAQIAASLTPALTPLIGIIGQLAAIFTGSLSAAIRTVVVPALQLLTQLLQGNFAGALTRAGTLVRNFVSTAVNLFVTLPSRILGALAPFSGRLGALILAAHDRVISIIRTKLGQAVALFAALPGRARGALAALPGILAGLGTAALARFTAAVRSGGNNAVSVARSIPGRIRAGLGNVGSLLVGAGADLMRGMINGIRSQAGNLVSAAKGVVGGAIKGAKNLLGISSPSKVFAAIGRDTGRGFVKGLTGTQAQIKSTSERVIGSITKAFKGRRTRLDDRLVSLVERGNKRLQGLAGQRDAIAQRIGDAQKFATDLTSKAAATGSLASIVQPDAFAPSFVKKGLRQSLNSIKAFTANVQKLQKRGASKGLIRQILELGPEQGAQFAASLAGADKATIRQFNSLNAQISSASTRLGRTGADLLYDSGKKAGQGFLTGLKAQQKNIEKLMLSIAKGMQKAIRRALGIKSPSRVMAAVGRLSMLGLQGGIVRNVSAVDAAMARAAAAVARGVPAALPSLGVARTPAIAGVGAVRTGGRAGAMVVNNHYYFENHGVIGSQLELDNWLTGAMDRLNRRRRLPKARAS